jgi:hypothetical protein
LLLQWAKLVTVNFFYIHPESDTSNADDDLDDTYTEHVVFLLKVNNPSVRHLVWPPSGTPSSTPSSPCGVEIFLIVVASWKRREKILRFSVFNPQDPQDPRVPRALQAKPREEEGFFGLVPLVTHPSSIPLLGGLTPKFLSLSFHSL